MFSFMVAGRRVVAQEDEVPEEGVEWRLRGLAAPGGDDASARAEALPLAVSEAPVVGDAALLAAAEQRQSAPMPPNVVAVLLQFQVVRTVVKLVAVAVVHILARLERVAQDDLHHQPGQPHKAAPQADADVTIAADEAAKWRAAAAARRHWWRTRS
jgi:hypothetical protein